MSYRTVIVSWTFEKFPPATNSFTTIDSPPMSCNGTPLALHTPFALCVPTAVSTPPTVTDTVSLTSPDDVPRSVKLAAVVSWLSAGKLMSMVSAVITVIFPESEYVRYGVTALLSESFPTSSTPPSQKCTLPLRVTDPNGSVASIGHVPLPAFFSLIAALPVIGPFQYSVTVPPPSIPTPESNKYPNTRVSAGSTSHPLCADVSPSADSLGCVVSYRTVIVSSARE